MNTHRWCWATSWSVIGSVLVVLGASHPLGCHARDSGSADAEENGIVLRYVLPAAQVPGATPAAPHRSGGDSDGTSDPTSIVYDETRVREHVRWLLSGLCIDGVTNYSILTPEGPIKFHGGLDEEYLGLTFRADDLTTFLQRRLDGKTVQREFHIKDPDLVAAYHKRRAKSRKRLEDRLSLSPWDRDTVAVISLLSQGQYAPARPVFNELTKDRSALVRRSAVAALGRIAPVAPEAVDDLTRLLSDRELQGAVLTAMAAAGEVGVPALIQAMDHPDEAVRNRAVFALPWMASDASTPALLVALRNGDPLVRRWAVDAVIDMQGRGKDVSDSAIVNALAALLQDENADTRRSAAISLLNLGPAAARAIPALKAAAKDPRPSVRRYATKAIRAIEGTPIEAR